MDLLEHAAGVWARKFVLVGVAILLAFGVFAWRSGAPAQYTATTTLQVRLPDTQSSDPSTQVEFYSETVVGLATSRGIVAETLTSLERNDDVDTAADSITAEAGSDPGFVLLETVGASPSEAAELADALAAVLIEQVAADQADDLLDQRLAVNDAVAELGSDRQKAQPLNPFEKAALEREREALLGSLRTISEKTPWRLSVLEAAKLPTAPSAPAPLRDALLALILALIIGAEVIVARRAWRGALSARDPGKDAGEIAGVPGLALRPDQSATALTPLLPALASARTISVVQSGSRAHARTAALVSELLAARGQDVLLIDANRARPTLNVEYDVALAPGLAELRQGGTPADTRFRDLPHVRSLYVLPAGEAPGSHEDRSLAEILATVPQEHITLAASVASAEDLLDVIADLTGPTVLDIDVSMTKRELRSAVDTVRGLGLDLVAVTVSTGSSSDRGRKPRQQARTRRTQATKAAQAAQAVSTRR